MWEKPGPIYKFNKLKQYFQTYLYFAISVEKDLAAANVVVSHPLVMHVVQGPQYLFGKVFQYIFRECSYREDQIVQAATARIVCND